MACSDLPVANYGFIAPPGSRKHRADGGRGSRRSRGPKGRPLIPDSHCHLDALADPGGAVEEALAAGVGPILAVSMDAETAETILALRDRHPGSVLAGVGLHPSRVVEISPDRQTEELARLEALAARADFIGEIGLDFKDALAPADRQRQMAAFTAQLACAARRRLPVNLHSRRADREVLEEAIAFRRRTGLGALMHWFTRSERTAKTCATEGVFISAGPSILVDPRAAAVAGSIDDAILLVETDTPVAYGELGPARPAWAARVLERLCDLRGVARPDLEATVGRNIAAYLAREM